MSSGGTTWARFASTHSTMVRSPRRLVRSEPASLPAASTIALGASEGMVLAGASRIRGWLSMMGLFLQFDRRGRSHGDEARQQQGRYRGDQPPHEEVAVADRHLNLTADRARDNQPQVHQGIGEGIVGGLVFAWGDFLHH